MAILRLKPLSLRDANQFVVVNKGRTVRSCKFAIGCNVSGTLRGVVVVTRPRARALDDGWTLELARVYADGTANVVRELILAATRAAFAMGARKVISTTSSDEEGPTYRAAGFVHGTVETCRWERSNPDAYWVGFVEAA
jgi:hypothetical protein